MRRLSAGTCLFVTLAMVATAVWVSNVMEAQSVGSRNVQLVTDSKVVPVGDCTPMTSVSTSTALTVPTGATSVLLQAQVTNFRWRDGSTAPDASTGGIIYAGGYLDYNGDLTAIRVIEESSGGILQPFFYRPP